MSLLSSLPEFILETHVAPAVTTKELGRFCLSSVGAYKLECAFARERAQVYHGLIVITDDVDKLFDRQFGLFELYHNLDAVADRAYFEFTRPFMAAVLKPERFEPDPAHDPEFMLVDVGGGRTGYRTVAACPPMQGDFWRLLVPLRRGTYRLEVSGWRNPHHGILDLTLNNKALSPSEGLDWYAEASTLPYTFPAISFEVEATGTHILRGETCRCNELALGAKYWICLESILILPVDEICKKEEDMLEEEEEDASEAGHVTQHQQGYPDGYTGGSTPAPALAARAAAVRVVTVAAAAAMLTGDGLQIGGRTAWTAAASLTHNLVQRPVRGLTSLACPRRRPIQRGSEVFQS
jgi:hypothetical protein